MNAEEKQITKRKIHKWLCIIIFTDMMLCSIAMVINANTWQNEIIDNILHCIGVMLETPLVIMFIKYMFDYHRLKKEQK